MKNYPYAVGRIVVVCGAVWLLCWPSPASAQPAPAAGAGLVTPESAALDPAQLIRQLMLRIETQEAMNDALLKRVLALEASQSATPDGLPPPETTATRTTTEPTATVEQVAANVQMVGDRLDLLPALAGYYDVEYFDDDRRDSPREFRHHHLSLHVSKQIDKFRVFNEVEFEYGAKFEGTGVGPGDARGEIKVEQSWGEYTRSDLLTLRAGLILSPQAWNVAHYPNVVLSTSRPLMVRKVFPESFVGIMGYGTHYWGNVGVRYSAYVGNGDSAFFTKEDNNDSKSVGGLVAFDFPVTHLFDSVSVGLTGYADQPPSTRATRTWGLESTARRGPFQVLFEFATRSANEDRRGLYVQPSYRLTERLMAFYRYDFLRTDAAEPTRANTWGLNFRPTSPVSLKFEYVRTQPSLRKPYNGLASSLAIAF